jgi:hypothetical protein
MRFQPSQHSYGVVDAPSGTTPAWEQLKEYPRLKSGDADAGNKAGKGGKYLAPKSGRSLYKGMVAELQRLLVGEGYEVAQDGYFGDLTEKAVIALNSDKVKEDVSYNYQAIQPEIVGIETWGYLYNVLPTKASAPASSTTSASSAATASVASPSDVSAPVPASPDAKTSPEKKAGAPPKRTGEKIASRIAARQAQQESREMWKNVALWGGVAVAGIGAVILIAKSLGKEGN